MESESIDLPLIVIIGPTASGKTALAIELAKRYNGEIICADSRTIYRGMDIGTAKPDLSEQSIVKHYGLDIVSPDERYSAADFKKYADDKIKEIRSRGHVPFLVGGTGLYINSVIFDYQFGDVADIKIRQKLNELSIEELHKIYNEKNIQLPENKLNKRYLIRGIERSASALKCSDVLIDNAFVVGISTEKSILRDRIAKRIDIFFENGVIDEAKTLSAKYGWNIESMTGNIYRLSKELLAGNLTELEMKQKLITLDWRLAKRQLTWFKRNKFIKWGSVEELRSYLNNLLENKG